MKREKCDIRDCPNKLRTTKYGKNLCKYHLQLIDHLKKKGVADADEAKEWDSCEWCMSKVPRTVTHHYLYDPESTVELCDRCHQVVHNADDHILQPSTYQRWQADRELSLEDLKVLQKCGKVKVDGLGTGYVDEDYSDGYKFSFEREEGDVFTDRRYHLRSEVEFLEEK